MSLSPERQAEVDRWMAERAIRDDPRQHNAHHMKYLDNRYKDGILHLDLNPVSVDMLLKALMEPLPVELASAELDNQSVPE